MLHDGRRYSAQDPDLVTWVHVAEMWSFLEAARRYGPRKLSRADGDRYFAETAVIGRALGATWVPDSASEAAAYLERIRPELSAGQFAVLYEPFEMLVPAVILFGLP